MSESFDLIAINERGVYAICSDEPGAECAEDFRREVRAAGHRLERVTTKEAVERHLAYLMALPAFRSVLRLPA